MVLLKYILLVLILMTCTTLLWIFKNTKKHYHTGPHKNIKYNKVFVINGHDYAERYNRTFDIVQNQLGFVNVKKWNAIFPRNKNMYKIIDNGRKEYVCSLKRGELGCTMSHRTLWKHIIDNYKDEQNWIIVFEDDISIPNNMKSTDINKEIEHLFIQADEKNVDVIYLGYCWSFLCTHAYALKHRGAKLLYDHTYNCIKDKPKSIDVQMNILRKNNIIKVIRAPEYTKRKRSWAEGLIHQTKGHSTIRGNK